MNSHVEPSIAAIINQFAHPTRRNPENSRPPSEVKAANALMSAVADSDVDPFDGGCPADIQIDFSARDAALRNQRATAIRACVVAPVHALPSNAPIADRQRAAAMAAMEMALNAYTRWEPLKTLDACEVTDLLRDIIDMLDRCK